MALTETVTLVSDPEELIIKDKPVTKLRFVIKAPAKRYKDRFVNGLLFDKIAAEDALRLRKGDVVQVTGQLALGEYFSKKEGHAVQQDEMGFGWRIERVIKSETFWGKREPEPEPEKPLDDLDL